MQKSNPNFDFEDKVVVKEWNIVTCVKTDTKRVGELVKHEGHMISGVENEEVCKSSHMRREHKTSWIHSMRTRVWYESSLLSFSLLFFTYLFNLIFIS